MAQPTEDDIPYITEAQAIEELKKFTTPITSLAQLVEATDLKSYYDEILIGYNEIIKSRHITRIEFIVPLEFSQDLRAISDILPPSPGITAKRPWNARNNFEGEDYTAYLVIRHTDDGQFRSYYRITFPGTLLSIHTLSEDLRDKIVLKEIQAQDRTKKVPALIPHVMMEMRTTIAPEFDEFIQEYRAFRNAALETHASAIHQESEEDNQDTSDL